MRDQPDGAALLDLSGQILRETLLPLLPREQKHTLLMIANAMAIAARQLRNGDGHLLRERDALRRLLELPADNGRDSEGLGQELLEFNTVLARRIRQADEAGLAAIHAHLVEVAQQRVRESNPAYLDSAEGE